MSNNLHRVQNIFISDGTSLPVDNGAISTVTAGKVAVFGQDMLALDPAGSDTITTQPFIYLMEAKTDSNNVGYLKRSFRIDGANVTKYEAESYKPDVREVWTIGYSRLTTTGTIELNTSTNYKATIRFKNDKNLYSKRPEVLTINYTADASATKLIIATAIKNAIVNSSFRGQITAVVVGNGTGVYGLTGATEWGVEIWALDINQYIGLSYQPNNVYFSVHVDDASGFGSTTTCTQIQAFKSGVGTYTQVRMIEDFDLGYEGITNKRMWPVPSFDYSSSSSLILSSAIAETVTGTIGEDTVTFSANVSAKIRAGEKVELGGVNYEIKYFISTTVAVLTSVLTAGLVAAAVKVRLKYDVINIEFNDVTTTPGAQISAVAQKSVIIAVPAIDAGGAYNSLSSAGTNLKALLDAWMASTPRAFANISI